MKNPFKKREIEELRREVHQRAYKEIPNGIVMSSGLLHYVEDYGDIDIEDRREFTGDELPLPWNNKPFDMRPYQREAVEMMEKSYRGIVVLGTALGKTLTAVHMIKRTRTKTLITVPSESIARQFISDLEDAFGKGKVGLYGAGKKKIMPITVGIVMSISNDIEKISKENWGLVIHDECHHTPANKFFKMAIGLGNVGRMYGLTATDFRSDGKDILIEAGCGKCLIRRDAVWGIKNGWLARPSFIVREVKTESTNKRYGRMSKKLREYKRHVVDNPKMRDYIYNDIKTEMQNGKSVLCLVAEIEHGEELSKRLGIPFANGSDKMSQEYVNQLNSGKIRALIGTTGKIGEGSNTKNVDVLVMANFMASKGIVLQSVGRGLRKTDTKDTCKIYDYIPVDSDMLKRHAEGRVKIYKKLSKDVNVVSIQDSVSDRFKWLQY